MRAVAISSVKARSAVVSVSTSGVLVPITPRFVISGTTKLSKPTARLATTLSCWPAASRSSASIRSVSSDKTASAPLTRRSSSSRGMTSSLAHWSISQPDCLRSLSGPIAGMLRVMKTFGISSAHFRGGLPPGCRFLRFLNFGPRLFHDAPAVGEQDVLPLAGQQAHFKRHHRTPRGHLLLEVANLEQRAQELGQIVRVV